MRFLILAAILATTTIPTLSMATEPTADTQPAANAASEAPAMAEAAAPAADAAPALEPVSPSAVKRASFATAISHREPVDSVESLGNDHDRVFFFTEIVGAKGRKLTHRWEHGGEVMAEVPISVGSNRWRAYSSKQLLDGWLGEWKVSVVDETGQVVHTERFVYEAAAQPEVATTAPEPEIAPAAEAPSTAEEKSSPAAMQP